MYNSYIYFKSSLSINWFEEDDMGEKKHFFSRGFLNFGKSQLYFRLVLILLAVVIAVVSGITIWNAANLQSAIDRRTQTYVKDVSLQLASDIDFRLAHITQELENVEDSLLQVSDDQNIDKVKDF